MVIMVGPWTGLRTSADGEGIDHELVARDATPH